MHTITVLGLGAMGARMATRLLDAGYAVTVWNRTPGRADALKQAGAQVAATPREAAQGADLVLGMVRDDDASRQVWLDEATGAVAALAPGRIAIASSTLTPGWAQTLGAAVEAQGARFLDAPVVGTRPHAERGQLTMLVGGDAETLDAARPVLEHLSGAIRLVGPAGTGMAMKLAVNALFAVQAAALAEVLATLEASGVERRAAAGVLGALPTASPAAARLGELMAEGVRAPNFPIELVAKDLRYAAEEAGLADATPSVVRAARDVFEAAGAAGYADDDIAGVAQLYG